MLLLLMKVVCSGPMTSSMTSLNRLARILAMTLYKDPNRLMGLKLLRENRESTFGIKAMKEALEPPSKQAVASKNLTALNKSSLIVDQNVL